MYNQKMYNPEESGEHEIEFVRIILPEFLTLLMEF